MSSPRKLLASLAGAAVALAGVTVLATPSAQANPGGTALVINEVYVNGGSAGATYTNKYVELFNPTASDIALTGMSIQYRPPGNTDLSSNTVALVGTVTAGGFFTFVGGSNGANGIAVPGQDQQSNSINPGAGGGTIALADVTGLIDPDSSASVVDKIGYGTSNTPEGGASGTGPSGNSVTLGLSRSETGADTDVNSADFAAKALTPDAVNPPPPPPPVAKTISEIQGDNAAVSPLVGTGVITQGVVTAAYPSGGFFGFYMQTGGTGGPTDPAARLHSDGIFVRQTVAAGAVTVSPGDSVEVTGNVTEFAGQTQVEVTSASDIDSIAPLAPVTATTTTSWPDTDAKKEKLEGMLYTPQGNFTISDNFSTNSFGELGLARGNLPLIIPTEVGAVGSPDNIAQAAANAANAIVLDDGSSTAFLSNQTQTPPYISNTAPVPHGCDWHVQRQRHLHPGWRRGGDLPVRAADPGCRPRQRHHAVQRREHPHQRPRRGRHRGRRHRGGQGGLLQRPELLHHAG